MLTPFLFWTQKDEFGIKQLGKTDKHGAPDTSEDPSKVILDP